MKLQPGPARDSDLSPNSAPASIQPGDYLHSERDLFFVVECGDDWAMVEECHSNTLIQVERDWLLSLHKVRKPSAQPVA